MKLSGHNQSDNARNISGLQKSVCQICIHQYENRSRSDHIYLHKQKKLYTNLDVFTVTLTAELPAVKFWAQYRYTTQQHEGYCYFPAHSTHITLSLTYKRKCVHAHAHTNNLFLPSFLVSSQPFLNHAPFMLNEQFFCVQVIESCNGDIT